MKAFLKYGNLFKMYWTPWWFSSYINFMPNIYLHNVSKWRYLN